MWQRQERSGIRGVKDIVNFCSYLTLLNTFLLARCCSSLWKIFTHSHTHSFELCCITNHLPIKSRTDFINQFSKNLLSFYEYILMCYSSYFFKLMLYYIVPDVLTVFLSSSVSVLPCSKVHQKSFKAAERDVHSVHLLRFPLPLQGFRPVFVLSQAHLSNPQAPESRPISWPLIEICWLDGSVLNRLSVQADLLAPIAWAESLANGLFAKPKLGWYV